MSWIHLPHDHGQDSQRIAEHLPEEGAFQKVTDQLRLLGDASRLKIFWILCHCEECVINLSAMMGMSSPALSHHLKQLKSAGLIVSRRDGKEVYYRSADTPEAKLLHDQMEAILSIRCPKED